MHPHSLTPHSLQDVSVGARNNRAVKLDMQRREEKGMDTVTMGGLRGVGVGARLDRLTPVEYYPSPTQTHACADLIVLGQSQ